LRLSIDGHVGWMKQQQHLHERMDETDQGGPGRTLLETRAWIILALGTLQVAIQLYASWNLYRHMQQTPLQGGPDRLAYTNRSLCGYRFPALLQCSFVVPGGRILWVRKLPSKPWSS